MRSIKSVVLLLLAVIVMGMCSCGNRNEAKTVADVARYRSADQNIVYIKENGQLVPFFVLTDDYSGNTLLLRKNVLDEPRRINAYSAVYEDSEIDMFLNNEYVGCLEEIAPHIVLSEVEVTKADALGISGDGTETIQRNVFLLSCYEVGIDAPVNMAREGHMLDFFKDENNRRCYVGENGASWWLRTPNTYYDSCTYVVGGENTIGFSNAYDKNGIRPAFCVKNDLRIELRSGIEENRPVYVVLAED